jgi:hypothetical protein
MGDVRALIALIVAGSTAVAAPHDRPGPPFPIAKLTVEATLGGEPADVELREDGAVYLRLETDREGKLIARIVGSTVKANDGRIFASLGPEGRLTVLGFEKPMRLRGCSLVDGIDGEFTLRSDGELFLKRSGQKRFSLPAAVQGDVRRGCPTALVLYRLLPLFVERMP